ncbi:MAG: prolyl oligopeptidase family serine peptidase [Pseudonocardia sp.]|nr:prolyl oligopeptidase family serine peptidase [Pseudonocardia sp.]
MHTFFKDRDMEFAVRGLLGNAFHRGTDVGEILSTIAHVPDGDAGAWVQRWTGTADRLAGQARDAEAAGHLRSAAGRRLRASHYYSEASDMAPDPDFTRLWECHRDAWDAFVDLTASIGDVVAERIAIPYEGTTLPGYFFARTGRSGGPARTLVYNNGSDGSVAGSWARAVAPALERGWNVATFDGPGQNAALIRQHLPFRPDWEHVLTPVVDHLLGRADVDPGRLAVLGISQGGYWVPRAAAFEHRFAAVVADPGVLDVSTTMLAQLPGFLVTLLARGDRVRFDRDMNLALRISPDTRRTLRWRMRPYGVTSPFEFFTAARAYALGSAELAAIRSPMLITDPDGETFWPGQSARMADALSCPVTLLPFTAVEGADGHCEPAAQGLRGERILDWLDERVPA